MARIGRDLALLMQPEVAEAFEPAGEGRGGSSAMPHKRNPVSAMLAVQAGLRAPGLAATLLASQAGEHERGLGNWQSDWWTLGALFECAGSATEAMVKSMKTSA
jgi:3-carboxy-cis,cis-muconate cycloisomerase